MAMNKINTLPLTKVQTKEHYKLQDLLVLILLILGAVLLYNTPKFFSVVAQILVLGAYARSQKPHYWLAILMFTEFNPGGLYHMSAPQMLSLIEVPNLGVVSFGMGFSLVTAYKVLAKRMDTRTYFRQYVFLFGAYMLLLIPIFGGRASILIRGFLSYAWLLFLPALLKTEDDLVEVFKLLFIFNFALLAMNIYQMIRGVAFVHVLSPSFHAQRTGKYLYREQDVGGLVRTFYGVQIAYLAIAGALYSLTLKRSRFSQAWLYSSFFVGAFNIVASATRGWMIGIIFAGLGYIIFLVPKLFRSIMVTFPVIIILFAVLWRIPLVRHQLQKSFERFSTVEYVLEGDISAGGTSLRHIRAARVMGKFSESPIIGLGFGHNAMEYADSHTGNQTMLLHFGFLGYGLYILLWLILMLSPILLARRLPPGSVHKSLVWLPLFTFGGLIIIHSTSGMYLHPFTMGVFGSMIFAMGNVIFNDASRQVWEYSKTPIPLSQAAKPSTQ